MTGQITKFNGGSSGMRTKIIHNQRLAAFLMARGFVLLRTEPDRRGNGRNVFVFKAGQALEAAVSEYLYQCDKGRYTNESDATVLDRAGGRSDSIRT